MVCSLWVYGAGGHGRVVAEAAVRAGFSIAGFIDDHVGPGMSVGKWRVVGDLKRFEMPESMVVAVGDNATRRRLVTDALGRGWALPPVVHPAAVVSDSAHLGAGVFVSAGAVVQAGARIGCGAVVNTQAVVEHDVTVAEMAHVGPGAIVCGGASVGEAVLVGAGAVVLPGVSVADGAVVGAGAVVVDSVQPNRTVVGVPATERRSR